MKTYISFMLRTITNESAFLGTKVKFISVVGLKER